MKNRAITMLGILSSIGLIAIGLLQGQQSQVLAKAIKICLECIGIG